jgi:hypothetical protein
MLIPPPPPSGVKGSDKIGMDCSVVPLKKNGLFLISTTDVGGPDMSDHGSIETFIHSF